MAQSYKVLDAAGEYDIQIEASETGYHLSMGKNSHHFEVLTATETLYSFLIDGSQVLEIDTSFHQDKCDLYVRNVPYHLEVFDPRRRLASQSDQSVGGGLIQAPMPGKIVEIKVKQGEEVSQDQAVVVIEAMKMQNELNAPFNGTVKEIFVNANEAVEADQNLILIEK